jgi:hypothetical protein
VLLFEFFPLFVALVGVVAAILLFMRDRRARAANEPEDPIAQRKQISKDDDEAVRGCARACGRNLRGIARYHRAVHLPRAVRLPAKNAQQLAAVRQRLASGAGTYAAAVGAPLVGPLRRDRARVAGQDGCDVMLIERLNGAPIIVEGNRSPTRSNTT